jgi:hypothetical protein
MFSTAVGHKVAQAIGNETRTLAAIERLSTEIVAAALQESRQLDTDDRLVVLPSRGGSAPVLLIMSPSVDHPSKSRLMSDDVDLPLDLLSHILPSVVDPDSNTAEGIVQRELLQGSYQSLSQAFLIAQPEVVMTRRPRMMRLCVPTPHLRVEYGGEVSTAGIYCRDRDGVVGVTGCFHGTGPEGTSVALGGKTTFVKWANAVQDIVFIPLAPGDEPRATRGLGGVRTDREPARADRSTFDGATNQSRPTRISGADAGLLRPRPTIMLKVQTDPDTDRGDSGCGLVDEQDRVLGFAFERTDYNDYPQFTDWIWAANALRSLELTPLV